MIFKHITLLSLTMAVALAQGTGNTTKPANDTAAPGRKTNSTVPVTNGTAQPVLPPPSVSAEIDEEARRAFESMPTPARAMVVPGTAPDPSEEKEAPAPASNVPVNPPSNRGQNSTRPGGIRRFPTPPPATEPTAGEQNEADDIQDEPEVEDAPIPRPQTQPVSPVPAPSNSSRNTIPNVAPNRNNRASNDNVSFLTNSTQSEPEELPVSFNTTRPSTNGSGSNSTRLPLPLPSDETPLSRQASNTTASARNKTTSSQSSSRTPVSCRTTNRQYLACRESAVLAVEAFCPPRATDSAPCQCVWATNWAKCAQYCPRDDSVISELERTIRPVLNEKCKQARFNPSTFAEIPLEWLEQAEATQRRPPPQRVPVSNFMAPVPPLMPQRPFRPVM